MSTIIYRPNAAGSLTELTPSSGSNYAAVDDTGSGDSDTTYVKLEDTTHYHIDLYNFQTPTQTGIINSVKVYSRCKVAQHDAGYANEVLYLGSTLYQGSDVHTLTESYVLYSNTWAKNPATSNNWEWSELTNLQFGVELKNGSRGDIAYCTQVYLEIDYTDSAKIPVFMSQYRQRRT
jgi:hypothetical protein